MRRHVRDSGSGPAVLTLLSGLYLALAPATAIAARSNPTPPWFWDNNDNGTADVGDSFRAYQRISTGWTTDKTNRVTEATSTWSNATDWNPSIGTSSVATVRVDGAFPCTGSWPSSAYAVNCVFATYRTTHYDIYGSRIGINLSWSWYYGTAADPPGGQVHFKGIMTHELGHGAYLIDLYPCGLTQTYFETMCGTFPTTVSGWLTSLVADDITSANAIYLP